MARQPREQYEQNMARLRGFGCGEVEEKDYNPGSGAYRYGTLDVRVTHSEAPYVASLLVELAIATEGYVTVSTFASECSIMVAISTSLDDAAEVRQ